MRFLAMSFFLSLGAIAAEYKVLPGKLHRKGKVNVSVLPDAEKFRVKMDFKVRKKEFVPVPQSLLEGSTVMEFPPDFRTEAGYQKLEKEKSLTIPKAQLRFVGRADVGAFKGAYVLEVHPTNKKSKIDIVYHPRIPSVGWYRVDITFLSPYPILNGYELKTRLRE